MAQSKNPGDIPLFRNISENMISEFYGYFKSTAYSSGDVIFKERSSGDTLFVIESGEVVIEKALDEEGREFKTLAVLLPGDFFGEMAVIEGQVRFAQARASKDTSLYEVGRDRFFSFIKEHPEAGISIFSEIMRTGFRRLQHTSSELTMLFDLSRLLTQQHSSPAEFLKSVLEEMRIYMEGSWNVKGYVFNIFNDEYEEVYARDAFSGEGSAFTVPSAAQSGWTDERTYLMACSAEGRKLAGVWFRCSAALSPVEKNNYATIFNTISSILGSAMVNIEHQAEAAMLEKLRKSKNTI